jgi:hypothetical protein
MVSTLIILSTFTIPSEEIVYYNVGVLSSKVTNKGFTLSNTPTKLTNEQILNIGTHTRTVRVLFIGIKNKGISTILISSKFSK